MAVYRQQVQLTNFVCPMKIQVWGIAVIYLIQMIFVHKVRDTCALMWFNQNQ